MATVVTWHDHRPTIDDALSIWKKNKTDANLTALRKTITDALNQPWVKWRGNLLIETNDNDKAYSCMDQADMAVMLLRCGEAIPDQAYIDYGIACMRVNTTNVEDGGLKTKDDDGLYFHGMTSRSNQGLGGTLNKHIHAVRSLGDGAEVLRRLGNIGKADDWLKQGRKGIVQLANGHFPSLNNFYVGGGQAVVNSWAYYAVNIETKDGRFLDENKNGGYHLYVMRVLRSIDKRYGGLDWTKVPLKPLLTTYNAKREDGLYVDSAADNGGDFRAVKENEYALDDDVLNWFAERT